MPTGDNPQPSRTIRLTPRALWALRMGNRVLLTAPCIACHAQVDVRPIGVYDVALGGTHQCAKARALHTSS